MNGKAYCSAYVGPFMEFTEMEECDTAFEVPAPECVEDRSEWVACPKCGAECLVEWSDGGGT